MEIRVDSNEQKDKVLRRLIKIHVPTEEISQEFRVYGYIQPSQSIEYAALTHNQEN